MATTELRENELEAARRAAEIGRDLADIAFELEQNARDYNDYLRAVIAAGPKTKELYTDLPGAVRRSSAGSSGGASGSSWRRKACKADKPCSERFRAPSGARFAAVVWSRCGLGRYCDPETRMNT